MVQRVLERGKKPVRDAASSRPGSRCVEAQTSWAAKLFYVSWPVTLAVPKALGRPLFIVPSVYALIAKEAEKKLADEMAPVEMALAPGE
jgi:hypothetical protein